VLVGQAHPVRVLSCGGCSGVAGRCSIAGPLCTALDYLARDVELPLIGVGDLVVIERVGAYGFTESMPYFLSHPTPAEVLIWEGREHVIRRRQRPEELWAWQSVPEGLL
ncbi:MAG: diaminopimelate decarboxylase, partial [Candidatus Bipolaricaulota bacterium]|nr:diaminopimelate decarboxylase [Candidatus Bipolaricaulota bacterium]MDW8141343.1 diaminopimelate decarboxylase [Candidatus Bipolaricaulota bacterium]